MECPTSTTYWAQLKNYNEQEQKYGAVGQERARQREGLRICSLW